MAKSFRVGEMLSNGWELFKLNLAFLISYQLVMYFLMFLMLGSRGFVHIIIWVLTLLVKMGFINSCIMISKGLKPGINQLYQNWRLFLSWIISNFFFAVMFTVGIILLVVPGCYVLARFGLFPYFLLDKNLGPIEALKQASRASDGVRWPIFWLFLASIFLNILGLLLFGVGLFITVPVTTLAFAVVYLKIAKREEPIV